MEEDRSRLERAFDEAIEVLDLALARVEAVRKNGTKAELNEASRLVDEALRLANEARKSREAAGRALEYHRTQSGR